MEFRTFDELLETAKKYKKTVPCALVGADSENNLEAVLRAHREGFVRPFLIGDEGAIGRCFEKIGEKSGSVRIIHAATQKDAAQQAVDLVRSGKTNILIKGNMDTSAFFSPILNKENGIQPEKILAGFAVYEIPTYHKLVAVTDGGITLYPTLAQKKMLIENAVAVLRRMGISCPKVAVLAAVEKANPKMPETMDAAALQEMNEQGEIKDCIVAGPISYDLAINKKSAAIKGFDSPVAGDADLLVFPDITSGNIVSKALVYTANGKIAMFAIGAKPIIIFGSRSSRAEDKYRSLIMATTLGGRESDDH